MNENHRSLKFAFGRVLELAELLLSSFKKWKDLTNNNKCQDLDFYMIFIISNCKIGTVSNNDNKKI